MFVIPLAYVCIKVNKGFMLRLHWATLLRPKKTNDVVRTWYGLVGRGRNVVRLMDVKVLVKFEHAQKKRGEDGVELERSKDVVGTYWT